MGGRIAFPALGGYYHATKYAVEGLTDALRNEVREFGIAVSLIEPGPIRTNFEESINSSAAVDNPNSPYAALVTKVQAVNADAYASKVMSVGPEAVAEPPHSRPWAVAQVALSRHPAARAWCTPAGSAATACGTRSSASSSAEPWSPLSSPERPRRARRGVAAHCLPARTHPRRVLPCRGVPQGDGHDRFVAARGTRGTAYGWVGAGVARGRRGDCGRYQRGPRRRVARLPRHAPGQRGCAAGGG